jgi:hypothetical protein
MGGMLRSPICSLLVIPTFARIFMPKRKETYAEPPPADASSTPTLA